MVKPISLSVHKNNREQKRHKRNRHLMKQAAKSLSQTECIEGFFYVSWDEHGTYQTRLHDPRGAVGKNQLPLFVNGAASRLVNDIDAEDRE